MEGLLPLHGRQGGREEQQQAEEVSVCLLADRPEFVPTLAGWFWQEWAPTYRDYGLGSEEEVARDMRERTLNRDRVPLTLVALAREEAGAGRHEVPCATVTLDTEDLPTHPHIGSWLVCVYTAAPYRGRGLVRMLLERIVAKAVELRLPEVWLWTRDDTAPLYAKYGWVCQEKAVYHGESISIMRRTLQEREERA